MSTGPDEDPKLLAAAEAIASRHRVDWQRLRQECDGPTVSSLQAIEQLLTCFATTAAHWPQVGDTWLHLQIKQQLGHDGHSMVYHAFDPVLAGDVVLRLQFPNTESFPQRLAEGQRMARVHHPHLLKLHGVAEHAGLFGLWSGRARGEPLSNWLSRGGRLDAADLVALGTQLCAAMATIHAAGFVHGDIRPDHVISTKSQHFVLTHFGIDLLFAETGMSFRTPVYRAPEVLRGDGDSVASDLYSLGAVLFHLACGQPPVRAESFAQLVFRNDDSGPRKLGKLCPELPPRLAAVIDSTLDPTPASRPRTAGELAARLIASQATAQKPARTTALFTASVLLAAALILLGVALWPRHMHLGVNAWPRLEQFALDAHKTTNASQALSTRLRLPAAPPRWRNW